MDIKTIDYTSTTFGNNFVESLHDTGFAIVKNHPIEYSLVKQVFAEWEELFYSYHDQLKHDYSYDKIKGDGYVGHDLSETAKNASAVDLKEFYQLYFPWGRYPKVLSNNTAYYFNSIYFFANQLLNHIQRNTPADIKNNFSEPLPNMVAIDRTMLRVLHYPAIEKFKAERLNSESIRASAHEDINLITLLPASNATGLQVLSKNGHWLDVGTNEGEIIVNVGDMLQECSNGYYLSATHRVINPDDTSIARLSVPLFLHPRKDVFLSHKYSRAEYYLNERLREIGLMD